MKTAGQPFQFFTAAYLTKISNCKASNLDDLAKGIKACSDASIFYHTFQNLSRHHFLTEGYSNDFAQWVMASCNAHALAEKLASLDIRDYLSLGDLREDLGRAIADYCQAHPHGALQPSFEPFYFLESMELSTPLGWEAWTLEQFREALERLSNASFHFHFIASRLRLHLRTNDFSQWFQNELGLEGLAQRTNRIDIYTNTLVSAREILLSQIDKELSR
ncbi:MAG: hypothetical protein HYS61_05115 [Acidobacteria bacterium]|nr:hypothetical protein [Acidobacteriota bacterium]